MQLIGSLTISVWYSTLDNSLAKISSRDTGFYDAVVKRKNHFTSTLTLAFIPTLTPTQTPTLTLNQAVKNEILLSLAGHVTKTAFCP